MANLQKRKFAATKAEFERLRDEQARTR
jgi:hypothetical protein